MGEIDFGKIFNNFILRAFWAQQHSNLQTIHTLFGGLKKGRHITVGKMLVSNMCISYIMILGNEAANGNQRLSLSN